MVHVIDAVLLPPTSTVVDVIVNSDVHNTLEAAVIAAELADDLSGEGPFTVFAPTDAAFSALPEGTVETLLEDPTGDLADILLYHVIGGATVLSTDLSDGQTATTLNGESINVTVNNSGVFINDAQVIVADIETDNGVVHVIDAVLLPPTSVSDLEIIKLNVFPNPSSEMITIELPNTFEAKGVVAQIFNMNGQLQRDLILNNQKSMINLTAFNAGVYMITFTTKEARATQFFIVE